MARPSARLDEWLFYRDMEPTIPKPCYHAVATGIEGGWLCSDCGKPDPHEGDLL